MAITFLDKDLKGEYKDAYERVEIYVQTMYMNEEMADEMLMNLLDSLLNAQAEGVPVEKIVGRDIKQFCKDYFAVYGKKEWLADFLKSIYRLAWVVFILELLEMTSSEEAFSISMTSDTWGYLVGAAIGGLFLVFDHLVVRPFVYRARKVNSTVYSTGRMIIVIALFIAAIFLTPHKDIEVPVLPLFLSASIYIVVYMIIRAVWRYRRTGSIRKIKKESLLKNAEKEAEQKDIVNACIEGFVKQYERINKKQLRKGKEPMSKGQFMEKLYEEQKNSGIYQKLGDVLLIICVWVIFIHSIYSMSETWVDAVILFIVYAVCFVVIWKFVNSISHAVWEPRQRILDECQEQGITIFEYAQERDNSGLK